MNDRTMIAAMAMQGMLTALGGSGTDKDLAERAVARADALLKALAGTEAEQDDSPPGVDEVGNWLRYTSLVYKGDVFRLARGDLTAAKDCFIWNNTPQGGQFWVDVCYGNASAADKARAQAFAKCVLEAMEEEHD